jgi:myosin heavy subunit
MKNKSAKFNNRIGTNNSFHSQADSIPEKIADTSKINDIDRSFDIEQEDLTNLRNDNFVESVGIEYQNLMNEMAPKGRLPSGIKPSNFAEKDTSKTKATLNNPTTIQISSNLDSLEQKIIELRQKRAEDNKSMIEQ